MEERPDEELSEVIKPVNGWISFFGDLSESVTGRAGCLCPAPRWPLDFLLSVHEHRMRPQQMILSNIGLPGPARSEALPILLHLLYLTGLV